MPAKVFVLASGGSFSASFGKTVRLSSRRKYVLATAPTFPPSFLRILGSFVAAFRRRASGVQLTTVGGATFGLPFLRVLGAFVAALPDPPQWSVADNSSVT
jgi:hypothetical protein